MFVYLANKITRVLINYEIIGKEDEEIYRYGFEMLIYFIVNLSIAVFIGILFHKFIHTLLFLGCYCTIRQFTGGYHANSYTKCTLIFTIIYLVTVLLTNNLEVDKMKIPLLVLLIISLIIIYRFAPLDHRNKPLSEEEKKQYKNVAINLVKVIGMLIGITLILDIFTTYILYPVCAIIWIAILLVLGRYKK